MPKVGTRAKRGIVIGATFVRQYTYVLIEHKGPLLDVEGRRCRTAIDHTGRIIWVDPAGRGAERDVAIARAVSHCWMHVMVGNGGRVEQESLDVSDRKRAEINGDFAHVMARIMSGGK